MILELIRASTELHGCALEQRLAYLSKTADVETAVNLHKILRLSGQLVPRLSSAAVVKRVLAHDALLGHHKKRQSLRTRRSARRNIDNLTLPNARPARIPERTTNHGQRHHLHLFPRYDKLFESLLPFLRPALEKRKGRTLKMA